MDPWETAGSFLFSLKSKINVKEYIMAIAIITGASSGIGEEFAKQLNLTEGIEEFWFVARRRERMEELAARLGVNAKIITADLTTEEGPAIRNSS